MSIRSEGSGNRLDDAARAGWLYTIAGKTQEEIAGVHMTGALGTSIS